MKQSILVPLFVFAAFALLSGCGSKTHNESASAKGESIYTDTPGARTQIGTKLRVRIVPGMKAHPDFPDLRGSSIADSAQGSDPDGYNPAATSAVTLSANTITFNRAIHLMENDQKTPRPLFIVLDEFLDGERISQVFHLHHKEDSNNHISYPGARQPALKDDVDRVWYIPLEVAMDHEKPQDADASQDHTITLDLAFQSRGNAQVHLKMRLQGIIPQVRVRTSFSEKEILPDPQSFLGSFSRPSFFPGRLILENPSNRKVKIWLKNTPALVVSAKVAETSYPASPSSPRASIGMWMPRRSRITC